jgi:guanylate kinase
VTDDDSDVYEALKQRIEAATEHVEKAERDLRDALKELESSDRAQKVMAGDTLRSALEQLAETRKKLTAAREPGD